MAAYVIGDIEVTEPAGNPCCDGPESRSGETWRVFADLPHGVAELLSVTTVRDDSSHSDDPEVDSETTYRAQITLDRDVQNRDKEVCGHLPRRGQGNHLRRREG